MLQSKGKTYLNLAFMYRSLRAAFFFSICFSNKDGEKGEGPEGEIQQHRFGYIETRSAAIYIYFYIY